MFARRRFAGAFATAFAATNARNVSHPVAILTAGCSSASATASLASTPFAPLLQQRRFNATDAASADGTSGTALDVAMKVNKLKRMHQSGQGQGKKEVERMAWKELNTLSEQQIATAEGKAVALLLNSWAYFARFWEKGKDGPYDANETAAANEKN